MSGVTFSRIRNSAEVPGLTMSCTWFWNCLSMLVLATLPLWRPVRRRWVRRRPGRRTRGPLTREGWSWPAVRSDTYLMDPFERRRSVESRLVPRREALAQAVAERAVELVIAALDMNALLDLVDLNAVLDKLDIDRVLERIDLDRVLARIDVDALVEQTDLGAVIARSSSGVASDALDVVRSQAVGLDEFIARWIGRLRRRPYTGPPGPPDGLLDKAGS